jgi:septal ring-binding cell division protein DamX
MEPVVDVLIVTPYGGERRILAARDLTAPPPASEPVDAQPFSHGFTGRHDGGALPAPGVNAYSHVIDAVAEAKAATDAYVVSLLPPAAAAAAAAGGGGGGSGRGGGTPQAKKARVGEPKDDGAGGGDGDDEVADE